MKLRKLLSLLCAVALLLTLAACGGTSDDTTDDTADAGDAGTTEEPLRVALLLNGTLGDKSFNDSAADGMEMIAQELSNVETKVVEMTFDDTKWEPAVLDACDEGYYRHLADAGDHCPGGAGVSRYPFHCL